jgi:hypothetical protein
MCAAAASALLSQVAALALALAAQVAVAEGDDAFAATAEQRRESERALWAARGVLGCARRAEAAKHRAVAEARAAMERFLGMYLRARDSSSLRKRVHNELMELHGNNRVCLPRAARAGVRASARL